jgi:acetyl-CoA carboxylase biotin carboxylase subunit
MRLVHRVEDVVEMYNAAKSEAMAGFGDDTVYIEKFVEGPHHIEFQILADKHGNVIHLYDRECSVQRRNQKIVEESPSPFVDDELREKMGKAAVAAAKAVSYEGAGTIEFLVDRHKNFYFLEMNTRLQVEHPITEEVIGLDLVKQQIFIAEGRELSLKQEDIRQRGHAIECRICAEDTDNNFRPAPGVIQQLTEPHGPGIRIDSAVYAGYEIPMFYDPMIGKLIVWATTRQYAIERMRRALYEYKVTGLVTNIRYLRRIIDVPQFKEGNYDTSFIEVNQQRLRPRPGFKNDSEDMAIIASYIDYLMNYEENTDNTQDTSSALNRWRAFGLQKGVLRV